MLKILQTTNKKSYKAVITSPGPTQLNSSDQFSGHSASDAVVTELAS